MLSLANVRIGGGAARLDRPDAPPPRARGDRGPGVQLRRGAQDRRPGDLARLPRRRARARRHARQRRDRRGRHPQPAHDPGDPAADRRRAAARRGPRRGLHVAARLHRAERAPRRAGALDVHEPAQLGRGDDPPARPGARRRAAAVDVVLRHRRDRGAALRIALGERSSGCARTASASTATSSALDGEDEVVARCLGWQERRGALDFEIDGVVVKVDDLELQRRLGVRRARPALGGGLEVPADHRGDPRCTAVALERRQVRRPAPVRGARAGPRRRRHGQAGDAAQRGGPRPQGHPLGRRRDRPARRRRDPAGRLARAARGRAARPLAAGAAAGALPELRHADGQGRASSPAARTATAPSAAGSCSRRSRP